MISRQGFSQKQRCWLSLINIIYCLMNQNSNSRRFDHTAPSRYLNQRSQNKGEPDLQAVYQYVPTIKQSGFIVGNPVAYTDQPRLPPNMTPFNPNMTTISPKNAHNSFIMSPSRQSLAKTNSQFGGPIIYSNPPPTQSVYYENRPQIAEPPQINFTVPPNTHTNSQSRVNIIHPNNNTIPKIQYDRLLAECRNWQKKYNEISRTSLSPNTHSKDLQVQNRRLRQTIISLQTRQKTIMDHMQRVIVSLVDKYSDSTLKQCMLLSDRYRLEKKSNEKY